MAQRKSGYDPVPGDLYLTPDWPVDALFDLESFPDAILEPAAGDHGVRNRIEFHVKRPVAWCEISQGRDFFTTAPGEARSIITNPPYSKGMAVKFIEHALEVTRPVGGKVAMLLSHGFDTALERGHLFGRCRAWSAKHVLTDRIRWRNLNQKDNGPSGNHAWYVWDWTHRGPAITTYTYDADPVETEKRALRRIEALKRVDGALAVEEVRILERVSPEARARISDAEEVPA